MVTTSGSNIQLAVYAVGDDVTSESSMAGLKWESDLIMAPAETKELSLNAQGTSTKADATMKVQIYVDGELKKEGSSTGKILVASTTLDL